MYTYSKIIFYKNRRSSYYNMLIFDIVLFDKNSGLVENFYLSNLKKRIDKLSIPHLICFLFFFLFGKKKR